MCFSTSASFGAGVVLAVIGVASVSKAKTRSEKIFAGIPIIFSIQQITEGFVWLSLSDPAYAYLHQVSMYVFLFIAQVVWPIYVPLSISLIEKKENRKRILKILVGIGVLVSAYLGFCLLSYHVDAKIIGGHISYRQYYPANLRMYISVLYGIATIIPPFFSTIRRMWILGLMILISYMITAVFYTDYIVSVWCFFASVISLVVFAIIYGIDKARKIRITMRS